MKILISHLEAGKTVVTFKSDFVQSRELGLSL